jgi:hypothetical protein
MAKYVYMFSDGRADVRALLGGKGANLAEMTNLGKSTIGFCALWCRISMPGMVDTKNEVLLKRYGLTGS